MFWDIAFGIVLLLLLKKNWNDFLIVVVVLAVQKVIEGSLFVLQISDTSTQTANSREVTGNEITSLIV